MKISTLQFMRSLFLLTVLVLVVFGVGTLLRINGTPARAGVYSLYAVMMFMDALALAFCVWQLNRKPRFAFYLAVIVLSLNVFLTIFDQVGLIDLLFSVLNLCTLTVLVRARKEFLLA